MSRRDDNDDDPSATKESEQPITSIGMQATQQGESSRSQIGEGSVAEGGNNDESEKIDALLDIDVDDYGLSEEEQGELSDIEMDQVLDTEMEVEINEHEMKEVPVEIVNDEGEGIEMINEIIAETEKEAAIEEDLSWKERRESWFRELPNQTKFKRQVDLSEVEEAKQKIISWFFDEELKLFAVKRLDGIQYFLKRFKPFNSFPLYDIKNLMKLDLVNPSRDGAADAIERIMRRDILSGKFEKVKPQTGKRVPDESRIDPVTGKPWMRMVYKPIKCLKKIPLKKMPQNMLGNLKWWYVDGETGEAVMVDKNKHDVLRVYDPLHLVNLSESDQLILAENRILYHEDWKREGLKYQRVIEVCVKNKVHAC